ncbi:MAG: hypothetical protein Q8M11_02735 [Sulfuritalea sp.]|nr:hypothetical protein [Sulfuritalea sp.]MDP1984278.1 hypothetical protein [Sulfuritalea sp.]
MTSRQREREEFSLRLRQALAGAGQDERSPTFVAKEFNRRFSGQPVTLHAARKWLLGEAIPSQDKVQALAAWLGVRPEWLRYGETEATNTYAAKEPALTESDRDVIRQFRRLNTGHRQAVREMLLSLLRSERRK